MKLRGFKSGRMSEDDYLALVTRLQQAMCIEPFHPSLVDVMLLATEWRMQNTEIERLQTVVTAARWVEEEGWTPTTREALYAALRTLQ